MLNFYKIIFCLLLFTTLLSIPVSYLAAEQKLEGTLKGLANTGWEAGFSLEEEGKAKPKNEFSKALLQYATGFAGLFGALYMILMIYAGYLWMNSRGNAEEIEKAKKVIIYSTVGIIFVILGRMIMEFIVISLGSATGSPYSG